MYGMKECFEGKAIEIIKSLGGLIAGECKIYQIWITGGIITITDENEVADIDRWLKEAKKYNANPADYLKWMIMENW